MKRLPCFKTSQTGQALLIVLLAMAVVLTVVLSIVSRSVTEVTVTSLEENALRAFSAAEAGVEQALLNPVPGTPITGNPDPSDMTVSYDTQVTESLPGDEFIYPKELLSGELATFWLVSHADNGQLTCTGEACFRGSRIDFCWGKGSPPPEESPAIEVLFFYDPPGPEGQSPSVSDPNNYAYVKVNKYAWDANALIHNNNFDSNVSSDCTLSGQQFLYGKTLNVARELSPTCANSIGCQLLVKVRLYYNQVQQPVGIRVHPSANSQLPAQGVQINSLGAAGESTRRVNVFQGFSETPALFDAAVFSLTNLEK